MQCPGDALLAAIGAWLTGADAAVGAVIAPGVSTELIQEIARAGIDVSRVRTASARQAARAPLEPTPDQLASVSPNWAVHLCGMSSDRQRRLIRAVSRTVTLVTLDIVYVAGGVMADRDAIVGLAAESDAILLGRREVEEVWPGQPPREVLRFLARRGARAAVVRLGGGPAVGIRDEALTWVPAFPLGDRGISPGRDAYAGAFAAVFAVDRNLARAMAWASAAASAVVESPSPLELLNAYARRTVESRARQLEAEARPS